MLNPSAAGYFSALLSKQLTTKRIMLVLATLTLSITFLPLHSFSLILLDALAEFKVLRSPISGPIAIFWVTLAISAPFLGRAVEKFGIPRVLAGGGTLLALGLFMAALAPSLPIFYLMFGVVASIGSGAIGPITTFTLVQKFFPQQLGTAFGITSTGMGGGLLLAPVIQSSVQNWGWRTTYMLLAACTLVIMLPIAFYVRSQLKQMAPTDPTAQKVERNVVHTMPDRSEPKLKVSPQRLALRSPAFWYLFAAGFLGPFCFHGPLIHQVAFMTQAGYSAQVAAWVVSAIGLMSIGSRLSAGIMADRLGRRRAYALAAGAGVLGMVTMAFGVNYFGFVLLYGILFGFSYAAFAPLFPAATSDLFGEKGYATIQGMTYVGIGLGSAMGAWLPGLIFDWTAHYTVSLLLGALSVLMSGFCYVRARRSGVRTELSTAWE